MTNEQQAHISVLNSFNLITGRNTLDEIVNSDVSFFAHYPKEDIDIQFIAFMIKYFKAMDMFEYCHELMNFRDKNFDDEGVFINKKETCECEFPVIAIYSETTHCQGCNKPIN